MSNTADTFFERKPKLVHRTMRIYDYQLAALEQIARDEKVTINEVYREFLDKYVQVFLHRKGTFSCQRCGMVSRNKDKHEVQVGTETFIFGDCCYFNDEYKVVVRQMI